RFMLDDHLGSTHVIADASGKKEQVMSFDVFGARRNATTWARDFSDQNKFTSKLTLRGYTGHEQMDEVGLVHMGGRVYDPILGRFLQADPMVQAPQNIQNFNRYSYVVNNPLNKTDPSGYIFVTLGVGLLKHAILNGFITGTLAAAITTAITAYEFYSTVQFVVGVVQAIDGGGTAMANFAGGFLKGAIKSFGVNALLSSTGLGHEADEWADYQSELADEYGLEGLSDYFAEEAAEIRADRELNTKELTASLALGNTNMGRRDAEAMLAGKVTGEELTMERIEVVGFAVSFAPAVGTPAWLYRVYQSSRIFKQARVVTNSIARLSDDLAGTFAGGRYTSRVLDKDMVLYRAGTGDRPLGQFFSKDKPISEIQTRIDKAVLPVWPGGAKSPIDTVFKVRIPAGTTIHTGRVGSQGGHFVGGTQQIVVETPWLLKGVKVLGSSPLK
ncbi:RHS repeat-associated core domain-containing protein, partial [Pseudoalteromonas sp. McH1-42]